MLSAVTRALCLLKALGTQWAFISQMPQWWNSLKYTDACRIGSVYELVRIPPTLPQYGLRRNIPIEMKWEDLQAMALKLQSLRLASFVECISVVEECS